MRKSIVFINLIGCLCYPALANIQGQAESPRLTPAHLVVLIATCQAAPGRYRGIFGSERRMPTHIMLAMPGYAPFPPDS